MPCHRSQGAQEASGCCPRGQAQPGDQKIAPLGKQFASHGSCQHCSRLIHTSVRPEEPARSCRTSSHPALPGAEHTICTCQRHFYQRLTESQQRTLPLTFLRGTDTASFRGPGTGVSLAFSSVPLHCRSPRGSVLPAKPCQNAWASQVAQRVKNPPNEQETKRLTFDPWVGKIPRRRKWHPAPILLPGESIGVWRATVHGVAKSEMTYWLNNNKKECLCSFLFFSCLILAPCGSNDNNHPTIVKE